jgi:pimeloyl-ACP methyl ester carboxylesterase
MLVSERQPSQTLIVELSALPSVPLQLTYQSIGKGSPLVFLHGFLGNRACWNALTAVLSPYYRCISVDLLGFGDSAQPPIRYDIAIEVAFVRELIQHLHLEAYTLVGHSFGGWVAAAYALKYGCEMKGLVLAAAAGIRDDSFCGRFDGYRPLLWPSPMIDRLLSLAQPFATVFNQRPLLDKLRWFRQELMAQPAPRSFLLDRLRPEDAVDTVEKDIHQLQVPTLVVTGDQDDTIPLWHSQTYAQQIPQAQLVVLPGVDHALPEKHAAKMADLIDQFLKTLPTSPI